MDVLFFAVRLIGITNPPIETAHNWRQTTVTMVARNYLEVSNNIFYPRIDIAGEKTGITGMEFPLLNYSIYLTSEVLDYDHWYGRLINLIISTLGIYFFYLLVRKFSSHRTALYSTLLLLFSIWFSYSRKIMPDTFSMSLVIGGMYFGSRFFDSTNRGNTIRNLVLFSILICLGVLAKLPSAYILILGVLYIFNRQISTRKKAFFSAALVVSLLPAIWWYFYWSPFLVEEYGFWHFFMGESFITGFLEVFSNLQLTLEHFYDHAMKFSGYVIFVFGLVTAWIKKQRALLTVFFLASLAFTIVIIKSGDTFAEHAYYIVPYVPLMAVMGGYGLDAFRNQKWSVVFVAVVAIEGLLNQQHDFFINDNDLAIVALEEVLNDRSKPSELLLINSGYYPTPMYFAHRKGWVMPNEKITIQTIDSLQNLGLKKILILKKRFGKEKNIPLPISFENEYYRLYDLSGR